MAKDVAKKAQISAALTKQNNLDTEFFIAYEGRKMPPNEIAALADFDSFKAKYGTQATLPALGCSLSHWKLYNNIANSNFEFALILEDDAWLSELLSLKIQQIIPHLPQDKPWAVLLTPGFWYDKQNLITHTDDNHRLFKINSGYMTSGYLINRSGAQLLAEKLTPVRYIADAWGDFVDMGLNLYGIVPHIISFSGERGEIGLSQLANQRKNFLLRICYPLAVLKGRLSHLRQYCYGLRYSDKIW